ncbi:MAG: hypothetical protein P4L85_02190 [Paludisphaera borealis]|uniref:hypothetical protein n=1 Tax=Paludisphaera borealis TaxID=1387353 RepID=UPI002842A2B2|nr:hypothetical protein [Paludisphaera borealis]MDR3618132.1 hypothetical protein [Paludisphaera borealis]
MSEDPLFNLETDPLVPDEELESEPSAQPQAPPVVMIQYRNRGIPPVLLFPTTLILSLGMFAAYHYLFVAPRQRELQEQAREQAASLAAATKPEADEIKPPEPPLMALSLDSQPLPPGFQFPTPIVKDSDATRVVAKPVDDPDSGPSIWDQVNGESEKPTVAKSEVPAAAVAVAPSPATEPRKEPAPSPAVVSAGPPDVPKIEPPKEIALGPAAAAPKEVVKPDDVKPTDVAAPVETPPPTPTPEEMQRSLEAEAQAKRIERDEQAKIKDLARIQVENEAQDRVEGERSLFREELRRIVAAGGSGAGQEIDELCDKFGRTYSSDLKAQILGLLSRHHGKVSRDIEVRMLRSLGMPEPGILDYLANNLHRSINSRNGPHSSDEVRVAAAKQLLRTKLLSNPAMGVGAPAAPTRVRQPQSARGAVSRPAR